MMKANEMHTRVLAPLLFGLLLSWAIGADASGKEHKVQQQQRFVLEEMWTLQTQPIFESSSARLVIEGSVDNLLFKTPGAGFSHRMDRLPIGFFPYVVVFVPEAEHVLVGSGKWPSQQQQIEPTVITVSCPLCSGGGSLALKEMRLIGDSFAWRFESDPQYPLTFKLTKANGYVYLCGRGTITTSKGTLHRFGSTDSVNTWLPLVTSTSQLDREGAAQALGWLTKTRQDREKAVPALVTALKDKAIEVRRDAAEALGRIGDPRAIEALTLMLRDESDWVRDVAQESLGLVRR